MNIIFAYSVLLAALVMISAAMPFYLIPRVIRRAKAWGILDLPDVRKHHRAPTPRLGGLSIMPAFWIGCSVALLLTAVFSVRILSNDLSLFLNSVLGLLIGGTGIFLLGCVDDFKRLTAGQKLVSQLGIVAISLNFLPLPSNIFGFTAEPIVMSGVIFLWLVIIPNSVNLLDGVDGLTASVATVFFTGLTILAGIYQEWGWLLILLPALAAILGFLKFNWSPARIFLGDSGSLLIGFAVAYLSIIFAIRPMGGADSSWNPLMSLLLTSVWFLDTFLAIIRRYLQKRPSLRVFFRRSRSTYLALQGEALANICRPDRKHLHHRLLDSGLSAQQAVFVISSAAFAAICLAVSVSLPSVPGKIVFVSLGLLALSIGLGAYLIKLLNQPTSRSESLHKTPAARKKAA